MVVCVRVEFLEEPPDEERQGMIQAAMMLTKDRKTVDVSPDIESLNTLIAVFRMKNEAQYRAIEKVWPRFSMCTPSRNDMTVWFEQEKAYDLRTHGRGTEGQKEKRPTIRIDPTRRVDSIRCSRSPVGRRKAFGRGSKRGDHKM
jgi:hypothetical protein